MGGLPNAGVSCGKEPVETYVLGRTEPNPNGRIYMREYIHIGNACTPKIGNN